MNTYIQETSPSFSLLLTPSLSTLSIPDPSCPAAMGEVKQFLHKVTPQTMREKGATIHNGDEVSNLCPIGAFLHMVFIVEPLNNGHHWEPTAGFHCSGYGTCSTVLKLACYALSA